MLRFLAQKRPTLNFLGFDRLPPILAAARAESPSNCQFVFWDYEKDDPRPEVSKCDALLSDALLGALCIDFAVKGSDHDWSEQSGIVDGTNAYVEALGPCFSNWRGIVNDGAHCTLALRLPSIHAFSAMCQVAMKTGWEPGYSKCRAAVAGDELFPVTRFVAGRAVQPTVQPNAEAMREIVSAWESIH